MSKSQIMKTGWWVALHARTDSPKWERFITPYISVIPWEKSSLASIPGYVETWSISFSVGWWVWRARFVIGRTRNIDTPPMN